MWLRLSVGNKYLLFIAKKSSSWSFFHAMMKVEFYTTLKRKRRSNKQSRKQTVWLVYWTVMILMYITATIWTFPVRHIKFLKPPHPPHQHLPGEGWLNCLREISRCVNININSVVEIKTFNYKVQLLSFCSVCQQLHSYSCVDFIKCPFTFTTLQTTAKYTTHWPSTQNQDLHLCDNEETRRVVPAAGCRCWINTRITPQKKRYEMRKRAVAAGAFPPAWGKGWVGVAGGRMGDAALYFAKRGSEVIHAPHVTPARALRRARLFPARTFPFKDEVLWTLVE